MCTVVDRFILATWLITFAASVTVAFVSYRRDRLPGRALRRGGFTFLGLFVVAGVVVPGMATGRARQYQRKTLKIIVANAAIFRKEGAAGPSRVRDAWGNQIFVARRGADTLIVSFGECGRPELSDPWSSKPGWTDLFSDDIVFLNGKCVRCPAWWNGGA